MASLPSPPGTDDPRPCPLVESVVGGWCPPVLDQCIEVEEHFGVLDERRRGLEVLEFWEIFVRDLFGRFGNRGILCNAGVIRINKLSVFNASDGFVSELSALPPASRILSSDKPRLAEPRSTRRIRTA